MIETTGKIEKILLIAPAKISLRGYKDELAPSLGLAYLAAVLEGERRYEVRVLDAAAEDFYHVEALEGGYTRVGLAERATEQRIREFAPDAVGVSCLFSSQAEEMMSLCALAKEIDERTVTVVGGEHPSALAEQVLRNPCVDFVVIGEGEYTLRDLLRTLNCGGDLSRIDGLGYRDGGDVRVNPKTRFIENLDELPYPARHLLPMQTYFRVNLPQSGTSLRSPNTSIMTSRGCPGRCIFCATACFWGRRFRGRSEEDVRGEMEQLVRDYGIRELSFIDDNLTLDRARAMAIFNGMIDRQMNLVWNTPQGLAVWTLDEEMLATMKRAGCYEVTFAVESGDRDVLEKIIRKPLDLAKVERLVAYAKRIGLITKGYFVIGLPGETKEQMQATVRFARRVGFDAAGIFTATPLPGTELYALCEEKGYLPPGFDFRRVHYGVGNIVTPEFTPLDVERIVSRALLEINLRLFLRNPIKFAKKYGGVILRNPGALGRYLGFLLRKSLPGNRLRA